MRGGERGYALLLAIAVVAALALAALSSARALADVNVSVTRLQENQNDVAAAQSVLARVAFLLLTGEPGARAPLDGRARWNGRTLPLDGAWRAVDGMPDAYVSVQDESGLFNLNSPDQQGLAALLRQGGVGDASPALAASLMDYVDPDDLTRDRGAEARDYTRLGLAAPADHPLSSRWQALESLGWRENGVARTPLWDWVTTGPAEVGLNVNTAPEAVLEAVLGDRRRAQTILARREGSPFTDIAEVEGLIVGSARADRIAFAVAPARVFRLRAVFGSHAARHGIEKRLDLGGADAARPFRWIEEREIRLAPLQDGEAVNSLSLAPAS